MPEFQLGGTQHPAYRDLDYFTRGYVQALFFTDHAPNTTTAEWQSTTEHDEGSFPGDVDFEDLDPDTLARIISTCAIFQATNEITLNYAYEHSNGEYDAERAGMDFWLTRNGHGSGYWDRDELDEVTQRQLTAAAKIHGEVYSYLSDAGKVCLS